jgi:hypothetical protein
VPGVRIRRGRRLQGITRPQRRLQLDESGLEIVHRRPHLGGAVRLPRHLQTPVEPGGNCPRLLLALHARVYEPCIGGRCRLARHLMAGMLRGRACDSCQPERQADCERSGH